MSIYKNYKLVTLYQRFIAETIARTGSEQLLDKLTRSYVGLYDNQESWYLPLRANIGKNKPPGAFFETPFPTDNPHFKRSGIDYQALDETLNKIQACVDQFQTQISTEYVINKVETEFESFEEEIRISKEMEGNALSHMQTVKQEKAENKNQDSPTNITDIGSIIDLEFTKENNSTDEEDGKK